MIVWLASYPRSGNTLLRTILKRCFGISSFPMDPTPTDWKINFKRRELCGEDDYSGEWTDFYELSRRSRELVPIKTHLPPADDAAAVWVVRDGRMALFSYLRFHQAFHPEAGRTLLELALGLDYYGSWATHYRNWNRRPGTLLVRYEDLAIGKPETLSAISAHLKRPQIAPWKNPFEELSKCDPAFFRAGEAEWQPPAEWTDFIDQAFYLCQGEVMAELGYPSSSRATPADDYLDGLKELLLIVARKETEKNALQKAYDQRQRPLTRLSASLRSLGRGRADLT